MQKVCVTSTQTHTKGQKNKQNMQLICTHLLLLQVEQVNWADLSIGVSIGPTLSTSPSV